MREMRDVHAYYTDERAKQRKQEERKRQRKRGRR